MEGIRDGFAGDDCFVCGLLWPGERPCRRCGGRVQWNAARMSDPGLVQARLTRAYEAWRADGDVASLAAFLDAVHADAPESIEALETLGLDLDQLRRAWQRAAPDESPD
jgi:hypothetical protein